MSGKSWIWVLALFSVCFLFFRNTAQAQQCDPLLDPFCTDPVPLDGGVSLLVAAGLAYGIKKIRPINLKE